MSTQPNNQNNGTGHRANPGIPPMTTKDLFELASLDALGILDEQERRAFDEAFAAATPGVQEQVRTQQSIMTEIDDLLPRVQPAASLRERVINAVLAAIGAGKMHAAGRAVPALLPSRGVNRFWRAGAIGFAAAAVVLGVSTVQMQSRYSEIETALRVNATTEVFIRSFGARFENALLDPRTQYVQFNADREDAATGGAVVLFNAETKTAQLYGKDLPQDIGSYRLVVLDENGAEREAVLTFKPAGSRFVGDIEKLDLSGARSLAITTAAAPGVAPRTLLRSNNL